MTYESFLKDLKDKYNKDEYNDQVTTIYSISYKLKLCKCTGYCNGLNKCKEGNEDILINYYNDYGANGGNCWGDEAQEYTNEYKDTSLPLKEICLAYKPNMSLSEFSELENKVKNINCTDYEYYGNYSHYIGKYILIKGLYEFLF